MTARIYKPARTAMQSGAGNTKQWILVFEPEQRRVADPLMGWTSSTDMRGQVKLEFDTVEEAVAFAKREGLAYHVEEPHEPKRRAISYSDNFRYNRIGQWTH